MNPGYVQITEKEKMWADMLMEVLNDNDIPCASLPVHGAGVTIKTGIQERLQVYVPEDKQACAMELLYELFPSEKE